MNRNFLYLILGALAVMAVFGLQTYWERQNTADVGTNVGVRIIDLSLSGAGVGTPHRPEIGSLVTLGKIPGRVVRHLEEGFAMEFTRLQHPDSIEENATAQ